MSALELLVVALLVTGAMLAAAWTARTSRIPYPTGLVVAGLVIGSIAHTSGVALTPGLVLTIFLPPLLFAGSWEMDLRLLRTSWALVAALATAGVCIGMAITWAVLRLDAGVDGGVAFVFAATVAATDPVAVIALFRELHVDRALSTIVEGESIFNDGVAVALFRSLVAGAAGAAGVTVNVSSTLSGFVMLTTVGAVVGLGVGGAAALLLRAVKISPTRIAVTAAAAYGAYATAEIVHGSGIIAVIASGMCCATMRGSDPRGEATVAVDRFWEVAAFLANSILFVLVGLTIDVHAVLAAGGSVLWAIGAVVAGRAVMVYGLTSVVPASGRAVPPAWRHIIALGGMRGALSMALVLSLPEDFHNRGTIVAMVYGVVLFTLVVQGVLLEPAMRRLGVERREAAA